MTLTEEIEEFLEGCRFADQYVTAFSKNVYIVKSSNPRMLEQRLNIRFGSLLIETVSLADYVVIQVK